MSKTILIQIHTENAAFDEVPEVEMSRILRTLAEKIEKDGVTPQNLYDYNGNRVGSVIINE